LSKEQGCKFFLWDEDAKPREEAALLSGARSEPRVLLSQEEKRRQARELDAMQVQQASSTGKRKRSFDEDGLRTPSSLRTVVHAATPPRSPTTSFASAMSETMSLPPKRKLPWLSDESQNSTSSSLGTTSASKTAARAKPATTSTFDDAETASEASSDSEAFDWPLSGQEAAELSRVAEEVELNTPRKARKLDVFDTPSNALAKQNLGLITPGTTPSKPNNSDPISNTPTYSNTDTTPTPSRYRDALATPTPSSSTPSTNPSLMPSFLSLLREHNITIPNPALSALTSLLRRNEAQLAGAVKGREIARQAVKAREETVAKLTGRLEGLEEEVAGLKALVSALGRTSPRKK